MEALSKERDEARNEKLMRDSAYEKANAQAQSLSQDRAKLLKENQVLKKNVSVCTLLYLSTVLIKASVLCTCTYSQTHKHKYNFSIY